MTIKASNNKNTSIVLTITIILVVSIIVLTSGVLQPDFKKNTDTIVNQIPIQSSLPIFLTDINETDSLNLAIPYNNNSSTPPTTIPRFLETLKSASNKQPNPTRFFFSFPDNTNQDQITESDATSSISVTEINETESLDADISNNNDTSAPIITAPTSLDSINFATYTYGGYSVQQSDLNRFFFSFPDNTNQGQIAGSDAITLNTYTIQKMDFDSMFIAPKIGALGFDEMVIFAASDTTTYKGTEFGIRLDLSDGFIYGYNQEPNGNYEDVSFQMMKLAPNDGIVHHYTLIMLGLEVAFYIDGVDYGHLGFPSETDYSSLTFSVLAVVHRFTDGWDSTSDNMIVENLSLNQ
jgi:hypothetical protein